MRYFSKITETSYGTGIKSPGPKWIWVTWMAQFSLMWYVVTWSKIGTQWIVFSSQVVCQDVPTCNLDTTIQSFIEEKADSTILAVILDSVTG